MGNSIGAMVRQPSMVWSDGDCESECSDDRMNTNNNDNLAVVKTRRLDDAPTTESVTCTVSNSDESIQRRSSLLLEEESSSKSDLCTCAPLWRSRPSALLLHDHHDDDYDDDDSSDVSCTNSRSGSSSSPFSNNTTYASGNNNSKRYSSSSPSQLLRSSSSSFYSSSSSFLEEYTEAELDLPTTPTAASDLSSSRDIWIVTTAALPWMTGTAVNPLLRAKYLSNHGHNVTLVLPWLESADDRVALYGEEWREKTQANQEEYLQKQWLLDSSVAILWYPARYHPHLSSIFALGDLCELLPNCEQGGVCILEEPEHVNFYRAPGVMGWRQKFSHVIGIIHTNYKAYAQHHYSGIVTGPIVGVMSAWMVRAYCDKVIKLSGVLQEYAVEKEIVSNVHGIRPEFLDPPLQLTGNKVYFLGKLLWAKGLDKLLELQTYYKRMTGSYFEIDIFGSGPEEAEIQRAFGFNSADTTTTSSYASWYGRQQAMPVHFPGRIDHTQVSGEYKIFVNNSITEVLCTSTAEAIARGRFVLVPQHPSNDFFAQFPNCLQYRTKQDFFTLLQFARSHDPTPLSPEHRHTLTWEAATARLMEAAAVTQRDEARRERVGARHLDERLAKWHYEWGRGKTGDVLRTFMGGGPVAAQHQYNNSTS